jgi:peroxiredoxin
VKELTVHANSLFKPSLMVVIAAFTATLTADGAPQTARSRVQDFTLPSATDSSLIRLSDHTGKVVLINWWRTDCAWSQRESPKLAALYAKYRDKGLVILGVSDDTASTVALIPSYLKKYNVTWPVGLNDQGEFMRDIRPKGRGETPGNYLVSRTGELTYLGLDRSDASWETLEAAVAQALAEPAPAPMPIAPATPKPAPALALATIQGKPVKLSDFAGSPVIVNFFTADSCDWAGAVLAKLHLEYAPRGLQVIGVNLFDDDAAVQACVTKHRAAYPVLKGTAAAQRAWIGSSSGWATFFVTRDGRVLKKIVDSIDNGIEATVFPKYAEHLAKTGS